MDLKTVKTNFPFFTKAKVYKKHKIKAIHKQGWKQNGQTKGIISKIDYNSFFYKKQMN